MTSKPGVMITDIVVYGEDEDFYKPKWEQFIKERLGELKGNNRVKSF